MKKGRLRVGSLVHVAGIEGCWQVTEITHTKVWVKPLDKIAKSFAMMGQGSVGFTATDLRTYHGPYKLGETQ